MSGRTSPNVWNATGSGGCKSGLCSGGTFCASPYGAGFFGGGYFRGDKKHHLIGNRASRRGAGWRTGADGNKNWVVILIRQQFER